MDRTPSRVACSFLLMLALPTVARAGAVDLSWNNEAARFNYAFEVAGYCGLIDDRVGHGFRAEVARIKAGREWPRERLDWLRGKAWQSAHAEGQNRGLGGFRGWCREEGRAAARRFAKGG